MAKYLFLLISFASLAQNPFYGKFRYYHMSTDNSKQLPDYAANAISGELGIKYVFNKHWSTDIAGSISSSFLNSSLVPTSRYEIGLFDHLSPSNQSFLTRIEKMNVQYKRPNFKLIAGRQVINTPFVNPQDGRMRPTAVGGIYASLQKKKSEWEFAYLYEMAPRGTMAWSYIGATVGYYPVGVNLMGQKSAYAGQLVSKGLVITGVNLALTQSTSLKVSNLYADQIANTAWVQLDYQGKRLGKKYLVGIQAMKQHALGNNAYDESGQHAASIGIRIGTEGKRWSSSINYNHISSEGRYLMPREWGKDPFFTFMPRERNEGFGHINAYVIRYQYQFPKFGIKVQPSWGYFQLPSVNDFALNKYGMPSYTQSNIEISWDAKKIHRGTEIQLLYVQKSNQGDTQQNPKYELNKVDMSTWNFIVNYPL